MNVNRSTKSVAFCFLFCLPFISGFAQVISNSVLGEPITPTTFLPAATFPGYTNEDIHTADLDSDGKTDLITLSNYSIIKCLENTTKCGEVAFEQAALYNVELSHKFAVGDLNGDGKPEIVVSQRGNNTVHILENTSSTGNIHFIDAGEFSTGNFPYAVIVQDFDSDGKADVVVVNHDGSSVSIFKNHSSVGMISFAARIDYVTPPIPRHLTAADIDGDGKTDLVIACQTGSLFILRNNGNFGTINFLPGISFPAPGVSSPENVVASDFDLNGKIDLMVSNNNDPGSISLFTNVSVGSAINFARSELSTPPYPFSMEIGDVNVDGKMDIILQPQFSSLVQIIENASVPGSISFTNRVNLAHGIADRDIITTGDFNYDNKIDFAITQYNENEIGVFLNRPDPGSPPWPIVDAGPDTTICQGASIRLPATSNGTDFTWAPAIGLNNPILLQPIASPQTTTTYWITSWKGFCEKYDSITVTVVEASKAFAGNDIRICNGDKIMLDAAIADHYHWSPGQGLDDSTSKTPLFRPNGPGTYHFILETTSDACPLSSTDDIQITVVKPEVFAGNDTVITTGQTLSLNAINESEHDLVVYRWQPTTGLNNPGIKNPRAFIQNDITYVVKANTAEGCETTDTVFVKAIPDESLARIMVPNAFTPNWDSKNDALKIKIFGLKQFVRFTIYNRWGQVVFNSTNPNDNWDGSYKGVPQDGTFAWVAEGIATNGSWVVRRGAILVLR